MDLNMELNIFKKFFAGFRNIFFLINLISTTLHENDTAQKSIVTFIV